MSPLPSINIQVKTSGTGCMTIFCTTRSQPRPNILWRKDGVRIDFNTTPFADYSLLEEGSLRVCNLAASRHNGRYRCDVSNTRGSAYRSLDIHIDHSGEDGMMPSVSNRCQAKLPSYMRHCTCIPTLLIESHNSEAMVLSVLNVQ